MGATGATGVTGATGATGAAGAPAVAELAQAFSTAAQTVGAGAAVPLAENGAVTAGITRDAANGLQVANPGTYIAAAEVSSTDGPFAIQRNGVTLPGGVLVPNGTNQSAVAVFTADAGDVLTLVNTSGEAVDVAAPGTAGQANASLFLAQLGGSGAQ